MSLYDQQSIRFLLYLYSKQEEAELRDDKTKNKNGVGFSAFDAPILTSIAKYVILNNRISQKQQEVVERRLRKYMKRQFDDAVLTFDIQHFINTKTCLID